MKDFMLGYFHIRIEQYHIFRRNLLQGKVISIGKAMILFQQDETYGRKLTAEHIDRSIRRAIVCHIDHSPIGLGEADH